MKNLVIDGDLAMVNFGAQIAEALSPCMIITLEGDLGAGKTTLSRGILQSLGHQGAVKSPTYTIVEPYDLDIGAVYHFDLYRITDPEELDYIGFPDYLSQGFLSLIEWPERAKGYLDNADVNISISHSDVGRYIKLVGDTQKGKVFIRSLDEIRNEQSS